MLTERGHAVSLGPNGLRCIQFNSIFAVLMLLLWFFPLVVSYRIKVNASYSIKKTSICAVIFSHTSNHNSCNVCQYIDILTSDLSVQITTLIYNSTILWSFVTVSFMVVILPQWQSDRRTNTLLSTHFCGSSCHKRCHQDHKCGPGA